MQFDPALVTAIMGVLGLGVIGIIELIKRVLKTEGKTAINLAIAGVVSIGATLLVLFQTIGFNWLPFVGYSFFVFGEATGLYHVYMKK